MYAFSEIWRYRRVWRKMIKIYEADCISKGAVVIQPGETKTFELPISLIKGKFVKQVDGQWVEDIDIGLWHRVLPYDA